MSYKKAYVIGTNVNASLSPTIFKYWLEKYNIEGEYGHIEIEEKSFDKEILNLLNKKKDLVGLNITIPYKEKIIPHLSEILTPHPKNIGSINFIWSLKKNIKSSYAPVYQQRLNRSFTSKVCGKIRTKLDLLIYKKFKLFKLSPSFIFIAQSDC